MFQVVWEFHVTSVLFESSLEGVFLHNTNIQIILWNFSLRNTTLLRNLSRNLKLFFFWFSVLCWNLGNAPPPPPKSKCVPMKKKTRIFFFYTTEKYEQANPLLSWIHFSVKSHDILVLSNVGGTYSLTIWEPCLIFLIVPETSFFFLMKRKYF